MEQREKTVFKAAVVVNDEHGLPNYMTMYYMEPGTYEPEDVPEMFKVNGRTMAAVLVSQFTNTTINDIPCSLPYNRPTGSVNFDKADRMCKAKGKGWHLMTNAECKYLMDEARQLGHEIHGNTNYGKSADNPEEKGLLYDGYHTLTGCDPLAWSHDGTKDGVFGLCGNFWEWVAGIRLVKGVLQYIQDNDAAEANLSPDSKAWKTAEESGKSIKLTGENGGVTITTEELEEEGWDGCHMKDIELNRQDEMPEMLYKLGIVPQDWKERKDGIWADSELEEAVPFRGSGCGNTSDGGVAALHLHYVRSNAHTDIGYRSALFLEDWKLVTEILAGA